MGVTFPSNFTFHLHYSLIVRRDFKVLGYHVRPQLEYASVVWSLSAEYNLNLSE